MGKLIVLEGIDGSGKSTQFGLLCRAMEAAGRDFERLVFPQYAEPSSALVRMYLGGEFGDGPDAVNAYAASTFFAVDRYASYVKVWRGCYESGGLVLADRYTTSNALHQAAKLPTDARGAFMDWLYDFEFNLLGLPRPNAVIYMDVPLETALGQMRKRERETATGADIHEADSRYLAACRACGLEAARRLGWRSIDCAPEGIMRPAGDIHAEVMEIVREML